MTTPETPDAGRLHRRPELERSEPIRNIFNAFRQNDGRGQEAARPLGAPLNGPGPDAEVWARYRDPVHAGDHATGTVGTGQGGWTPGPLWAGAGESVQAGYRVLEQQIREGQAAAQTFSNGAAFGGASGAGMQPLLNRLMQSYSDLGSVWMELLRTATASAAPGPQPAAPEAAASAPASAPAPVNPGIAVELTAACRATVRARLYRPVSGALQALPLRGVGPEAAEITGVGIAAGPCVKLDIPTGTPPGQYHGLLLEEGTEEPAGSVSVTVLDA